VGSGKARISSTRNSCRKLAADVTRALQGAQTGFRAPIPNPFDYGLRSPRLLHFWLDHVHVNNYCRCNLCARTHLDGAACGNFDVAGSI
jgi:hypothetical protein